MNHTTRLPGQVVVFSTVSYEAKPPNNPRVKLYPLRLWHAASFRLENLKASRVNNAGGTNVADFWMHIRSLMSKHRPVWLFGHNLGWHLGVLEFWRTLEDGTFSLTGPMRRYRDNDTGTTYHKADSGLLVAADPPCMVCCWDKRLFKLKIVDIKNHLPYDMKALEEYIEYVSDKFDMTSNDSQTAQRHCFEQVNTITEVLMRLFRFVSDNNLGVFKYTVAAQSMAAFQHRFMTTAPVLHDNREARNLERDAYYGARTTLFYQGEVVLPDNYTLHGGIYIDNNTPREYTGPVYALDMKAAYASVMLNKDYPYRLLSVLYNPQNITIDFLRHQVCSIADVYIRSYDKTFPKRHDKKIQWVRGEFRTVLPGPELVMAMEKGLVTRINRIALYSRAPILSEFAKGILQLEKQCSDRNDSVLEHYCKQMRNALHGKFGQHSYRWDVVAGEVAPTPWGFGRWFDRRKRKYTQVRYVGGNIQYLNTDADSPGSFPAIAAYVTSYCRLAMDDMISICTSRNVFYEEADTLHVSRDGLNRLQRCGMVGTKPGQFKLGGSAADRVIYYACKHYQWNDTLVLAGWPHNATLLDDGTYEVEIFPCMNDMITRGQHGFTRVRTVNMRKPIYQIGGEVSQSGWISSFVLYDPPIVIRIAGNAMDDDGIEKPSTKKTEGKSDGCRENDS